jgi:DNA-binding response OmpR family regulator
MRIAIYHNDPFEARRLDQQLADAGHHVFVVGSRYALVTLLDRSTMDLVVTEWHGMLGHDTVSGHWLIREARNAAVIFTSSDVDLPDIGDGHSEHMVAFLQLPASSDRILREVNTMIRRAFPWQTTAQYDVGPYSIDLIRRTIRRGGEQFPEMNDVTFRLAYCLLVNSGRRLSRDYLKEFVGGAAATSQGRYIDTLVGMVKKILLSRTRTGLRIRSVYGFGYILELGKGGSSFPAVDGKIASPEEAGRMCIEMRS